MKALKAGDVMVQEVISVQSKIDLRELEKIFLERKISGAPVVDQKGVLVGVISQTDPVNFHFQEGELKERSEYLFEFNRLPDLKKIRPRF